DIIAQRRRAISALPAGAAGAPASPTPPPQGQGGSRGAQGQLQRLRETSMDQLRRLKSSAAVPTGALDLDPEAAAAGGFSEAAAAAGEESSPTLAMRRSGTALTAASSPAEGSAFWLGLFAGDSSTSLEQIPISGRPKWVRYEWVQCPTAVPARFEQESFSAPPRTLR
ncbi:unnamed protein product, partial [Prorocentrum cordatum]